MRNFELDRNVTPCFLYLIEHLIRYIRWFQVNHNHFCYSRRQHYLHHLFTLLVSHKRNFDNKQNELNILFADVWFSHQINPSSSTIPTNYVYNTALFIVLKHRKYHSHSTYCKYRSLCCAPTQFNFYSTLCEKKTQKPSLQNTKINMLASGW